MMRLLGTALIVAAVCGPVFAVTAQTASPVHHEAIATIDPESRRITVSDTLTIRGRKELSLRLAPWMKIEGLSIDGRPIPAPVPPAAWPTALPDRGTHRVVVRLSGTVPAPQPARRRGAGNFRAALGPEGGYLFDGAGWFPDTGDARVTYRLRVTVPNPWRAVATGRLSDEQSGSATYAATFTADEPSAPPALFLGPYDIRERLDGDLRIRTYFPPDLAGLSDAYLADSAQYLARYQAEIGPYPYRDFHVIAAPIPVGLGFPNLTYIGRRILPLPFIRARSLAHEVLHNWWGNGITVDYRKGNWAEGLTTYMADYALAAEKDAEQGLQMRLGWLRDYTALPKVRDTPVNQFTAKHDDAAQVIGYNKAAFIFHMLKQELGAKAFTESLRLFWREQRNRTADWDDLRGAFEAASTRDLKWFFAQWLDKAGAPRLHIEQVRLDPPSGDGTHRLRFAIRQDVPAYRLTVPVVIETEDGARRVKIQSPGGSTSVDLMVDSRPIALHIDPGYDIFRRLARGEAPYILRDVTLASRPITVIVAKDKELYGISRELAGRLLDGKVRVRSAIAPNLKIMPHVIIGSTPEVRAFLARHRLPATPATLAGRGTARVWTTYGPGNHPTLVIEAENADALRALLRPLPHYGSRSYLVFDGRQAIDKGTWPVTNSPLTRRF